MAMPPSSSGWGPPNWRPPEPPPPGKAQRLVAESGFVLYEGGQSVFDESVLVYLAGHRRRWPESDVTDHVGRPLASVRTLQRTTAFRQFVKAALLDLRGNQMLRVTPRSRVFSQYFEVTGTAKGRYRPPTIGGQLSIEANREHFGSIVGPAVRGLSASKLRILDAEENQVGAIRVFREGSFFSYSDNYVMSIDPALNGPLRHLLTVAPLLVAYARRAQQQGT